MWLWDNLNSITRHSDWYVIVLDVLLWLCTEDVDLRKFQSPHTVPCIHSPVLPPECSHTPNCWRKSDILSRVSLNLAIFFKIALISIIVICVSVLKQHALEANMTSKRGHMYNGKTNVKPSTSLGCKEIDNRTGVSPVPWHQPDHLYAPCTGPASGLLWSSFYWCPNREKRY